MTHAVVTHEERRNVVHFSLGSMRLCVCNWINDRFLYLMLIYLDLNVETNSHQVCDVSYKYVNQKGPSDLLVNISWEMNEKFEWKSRRSSIYFFFFSFFRLLFISSKVVVLVFSVTTAASALCFRYFVAFAPCYTLHGAWKMVPPEIIIIIIIKQTKKQ